jgi:hypothetical protein
MTLEEILAELNKLDRQTVVTGLQASAQPIFQAIYDKGVGFQTVKHTAEKTSLEGQVTGLQTQIAEKDKEIQKLTEKAPEAATLRTQYEAKINQLKEDHKNELKARDTVLVGERRTRSLLDLKTKLISAGVDPDYADVLTNKSTTTSRFKFDDKGEMSILAADSEVPIIAAKGKDALEVMAEELRTSVPAKFVLSNGDGGSGTNGQGGKGKAGGNLYEEIRQDAKKRSEQTKAPSARERMGIGTK